MAKTKFWELLSEIVLRGGKKRKDMKNKTEKLEEMKAMIFSTNPFGKAESGISEYGD